MPDLRSLADDVLEATVVLSFTDLGPRIRRRLFSWEDLDRMRRDDRVVLVTGVMSGLGRAAATQMARVGASLRLLVRDRGRGEGVRDEIVERTSGADVRLGR